jgi:60 kDa SS-A/Ro ribonucleoprotein
VQYSELFNTKKTPQTDAIPGREDMVENNAGGFVFGITPIQQLERFLILGSEGGTYYTKEKKLTKENAENIVKVIKTIGPKAISIITEISLSGRSHKRDTAIFALALCCTFGDQTTKGLAYDAIKHVCNTGTQLFSFCQSIQDLRGWSRGLRRGVGEFYLSRLPNDVAYQVIKYRQRNGWTHRDVLRLCHAGTKDETMNAVLRVAANKPLKEDQKLVPLYEAYIEAQTATTSRLCALIEEYRLPREAIPTEKLNKVAVWEAMLPKMPMHALIRNLGVMSANGTLKSNFDANVKIVLKKLNEESVKKSKLHPISILLALKTYASGKGFKGSKTWKVVPHITDALDAAFYFSFSNVGPTGKNTLISLDVSGSMSSPILGTNISAREASSAMAMVTARCEPNHQIMAFSDKYMKLDITPRARLIDVCHATEQLPFSATDCSLPMLFANKLNLPIDTFVVYTDNETYTGSIHPKQALDLYRKESGINAKLIVCATTATSFSIADPTDPGMLDIAGFDASVPELIRNFVTI